LIWAYTSIERKKQDNRKTGKQENTRKVSNPSGNNRGVMQESEQDLQAEHWKGCGEGGKTNKQKEQKNEANRDWFI